MGRELEVVRAPSVAAWNELTALLEARRAAGEDLAPWVATLLPALARWPAEVPRLLPLRWTYRLAARGALPEAALADTLLLSDRWALTHFKEFRRLGREDDEVEANGDEYDGVDADGRSEQERVFQAELLMGIRRVDVSYFSEGDPLSPGPMVWLDSAAPLLDAAFLPGLEELDLSCALEGWEDPGEQLALLVRRAPALRVLKLSGNMLGEEALLVLAACPEVGRLQRLVLTGNDAGPASRAAMREAGLAGVVEDLDDEDA